MSTSNDPHSAAQHPEDLVRLFIEHANAGNVEGLVGLYESDAVLAVGDPVARGHAEIRTFYTDLLARKRDFPAPEQLPAIINDDVALTATRQANGNISVEIAHRQADGSWRWKVDQLKIKPLIKG